MAQWLDTFFFAFDKGILEAIHRFAMATGGPDGILHWFMKFISLLGEEGICLILLGLGMLLFRRTRKAGLCVLLAIACGGIITNLTIKQLVARPRPFNNEAFETFRLWWTEIAGPVAGEKSFPSGHTTSMMAAMTAIFLSFPKKYSWTAFIMVVLTGISRMWLMVHYPTDIIGGLLAGAAAAAAGYFLAKGLLALLRRHRDRKAVAAVLDFDLIALLTKKKAAPDAEAAVATEENDQNPHNG